MELYDLLRRDHPATQGMYGIVLSMEKQQTELEEHSPCDPILKPNLLSLLNQWIQIRLSDRITW